LDEELYAYELPGSAISVQKLRVCTKAQTLENAMRPDFAQSFIMPGDVIAAVNGVPMRAAQTTIAALSRVDLAISRATTGSPQSITVLMPQERARRALLWQRACDLYSHLDAGAGGGGSSNGRSSASKSHASTRQGSRLVPTERDGDTDPRPRWGQG